jgi:secreted trypsin-like serine protease
MKKSLKKSLLWNRCSLLVSSLASALMLGCSSAPTLTGNLDPTVSETSTLAEALPAPEATPWIVGGSPALPGEWPSTVYLSIDRFACGGTLIRPNWVLTAAHCVVSRFGRVYSPRQINATLGRTDLTRPVGEVIGVSQVIVHPSYRRSPQGGADVALLRLSRNSTQPTLPLIPKGSGLDAAGVEATVVGWGATSQGGLPSSKLLELSVPIVSNTTCNQPASYNGQIKPDMICAGFAAGGKDSCQGDSGGPLMARRGLTWYSIGIVSWGDGCAQPNKYGVYARVETYLDWINSQTR